MGKCVIQLITAGKGCIKCQTAKKKIDDVLKDYKGKVTIEELDITEDPSVLGKFSIMATPAIIINGELAFEGTLNEKELNKIIQEALQ